MLSFKLLYTLRLVVGGNEDRKGPVLGLQRQRELI